MAVPNDAKKMTTKAKMAALQEENETLRRSVKDLENTVNLLKKVNDEQLGRLVNQVLLQAHTDDLKRRLEEKN